MSTPLACPRCGTPNAPGNAFCVQCGVPLRATAAPPSPPPVYPSPYAPAYPSPYPPPAYPPPMYAPRYRRADFSSMFSGVFEVWTKGFLEFFLVYFLVSLLTGGLSALGAILFLRYPLAPGGLGGVSFTFPTTGIDVVGYLAYEVVAVIISLIIGSIVLGGVTDYSVRHYRGENVRIGDALARGLQKFPSILGANLVVTVIIVGVVLVPAAIVIAALVAAPSAVALGALIGFACALPFLAVLVLYIYFGLFLYAPLIMVEGAKALDSLEKSWNLMKGHKWSLFAAWLVVIILSGLVSVAVFIAAAVSGNNVFVGVLIGALVSGIVGAWVAILAAVAYDLIVKEPKPQPMPPAYGPPPYRSP